MNAASPRNVEFRPGRLRPVMAGPDVGAFTPLAQRSDVVAVVVVYNDSGQVLELLECLRRECQLLRISVVVADNGPASRISGQLNQIEDIAVIQTGGNLGYAGGINLAMGAIQDTASVLILNPDLVSDHGAIWQLLDHSRKFGNCLTVPTLVDGDGKLSMSLRREPTLLRAVGDALCGRRLPWRPGWFSGTDFRTASYATSHAVDWATGASLLVPIQAVRTIGPWDERFFLYSEETDFFRRAREGGLEVRYTPRARMAHGGAGSGSSPELDALAAVNSVRYMRKYHSALRAAAYRLVVLCGSLLRPHKPGQRRAAQYLLGVKRWEELPQATRHQGRVGT